MSTARARCMTVVLVAIRSLTNALASRCARVGEDASACTATSELCPTGVAWTFESTAAGLVCVRRRLRITAVATSLVVTRADAVRMSVVGSPVLCWTGSWLSTALFDCAGVTTSSASALYLRGAAST